jgi:hypothetical protein
MAGLVLELQREALRKGGSVSDLLRMAMVVSRKLDQKDFQKWIDAELNGYYGKDLEIPSYRQLHGLLKAWNPFNGWIPVFMRNAEQAALLSSRPFAQSIGEIESLLNQGGDNSGGELISYFPAGLEQSIMMGARMQFRPAVHIGTAGVHGILDNVRNIVLDWALKL